MNAVKIIKKNEIFALIKTDNEGIHKEISEFFSFYANNYIFHPKYKNKLWNGKIYLYNYKEHLLYQGLIDKLIEFGKSRNYDVLIQKDLLYKNEFSLKEADEFVKSLNLPFEIRDYQLLAFAKLIRNKKRLIISPTGSGKSLVYYLVIRYLLNKNKRGILIVPTTTLCDQLKQEFETYSQNNRF